MNKLPIEFKEKWLSALRSGEYKQGKGKLFAEDNTYCCLGVAAHLCGVPNYKLLNMAYVDNNQFIETRIPPPEGYPREITMTSTGSEIAKKLAVMNDDGKSFIEIADWIEANL